MKIQINGVNDIQLTDNGVGQNLLDALKAQKMVITVEAGRLPRVDIFGCALEGGEIRDLMPDQVTVYGAIGTNAKKPF